MISIMGCLYPTEEWEELESSYDHVLNVFSIIKLYKADVVTGPQIYLTKSKKKISNYSEIFEKQYTKDKTHLVRWAASNNVIVNYNIIKKHKLIFNKKLNKFGVGEDQLFFSNINKLGYKIFWNKNIKVYEKLHEHRQTFKWLIERSYRLGVLGHFIDIKMHGTLYGMFINYIKSLYYFWASLFPIYFFFRFILLTIFWTFTLQLIFILG